MAKLQKYQSSIPYYESILIHSTRNTDLSIESSLSFMTLSELVYQVPNRTIAGLILSQDPKENIFLNEDDLVNQLYCRYTIVLIGYLLIAPDLRDFFWGIVVNTTCTLSPEIIRLLPIIVNNIIRKLVYSSLIYLTEISSRVVPGERSMRGKTIQENQGAPGR